MRISEITPLYIAATRDRDRFPHIRVERGAQIPGLTRHGAIGKDAAALGDMRGASLLPPHRGRFVDVTV